MPAFKITDNIYSVGAIDYDVRMFHGYQTPYGATYNAYLVLDDKITLIDFVKKPFTEEHIKNIEEIVPLESIDYIISNHIEPDHSGSLPSICERIPDVPVYCTAGAQRGLKAYYKKDFNCINVKTGDTLCTGKYTFTFLPMPMVHWPDSMSTYLAEEQILFSNDAFGQHIASRERYDDELGLDRLLERAGNYYANIVLPFGMQVQKILSEAAQFPIRLICPSHGVMLRSYIKEMVDKYQYWSTYQSDPNKAIVIFDTMWGATEIMAHRIAGRFQAQGLDTQVVDLRKTHYSVAMGMLLEAGTIAIGSSTLNRTYLPMVAAMLNYMKGLGPKGRTGLAFGSYGWSGESIPQVHKVLEGMGFTMLPDEKQIYMPD